MTDFLAGFIAGTTSCYVGHPFDTIKTLLQLNPQRYNGSAVNCFQSIIREHGVKALYRGVTLPAACSAITNGLMFQAAEVCYDKLNAGKATGATGFETNRFLGGCASGLLGSFVVSPFETVKCRMQAMRIQQLEALTVSGKRQTVKSLESLGQTVQRISMSELCHGGLIYTILRDTPAFGLYFYIFYGLKNKYNLQEPRHVSDLAKFDTWFLSIAGGLGASTAWIVCYPIDVLKSQKQVFGKTPPLSQLAPGWWYRGLAPTLLRTVPVNMVRFTVYLFVKNNL